MERSKSMRTLVKRIRVAVSFARLVDTNLLARATAVYRSLFGNPSFPEPPVDPVVFKAALDTYSTAIATALDKSIHSAAIRQKRREEIVGMMRQLAHYVEVAAGNDAMVVISSGFELASFERTVATSLDQPGIRRIEQGQSGELRVKLSTVHGARSYEVRWAEVGGEQTPAWSSTVVVQTKSATSFGNLKPGTTYAFQVRAFGTAASTGWSDPATRMSI
jgi:hypothetical protein